MMELQMKAPDQGFIKDTDEMHFEQDVLRASMTTPVIVDFWATWCGPCKQMMPALQKAVNDAGGAVRMVKVDVDKNQGLAQAMRIQSVPTVYAFFQGQPVDGFMGAKPESEIRAFIERLKTVSGVAPKEQAGALTAEQVKKLMTEADGFFQQNKLDEAMARYSAILDADGENMEALGGIGWCLLNQGETESVREMLSQLSPQQLEAPKLKGLQFILSLGARAEGLEDTLTLERKVLQNAKDFQARFDLALQYLAAGMMGEAIDALVELIRLDRNWQDQQARTFLLEVFEALGNAHPLTLSGRRKLSSVLFS